MKQEYIEEVIRRHQLWLNEEDGGKRADLSDEDLRDVDLRCTNLCGAELCNANLSGADMGDAKLCYACNMHSADLRGAKMLQEDVDAANLSNVQRKFIIICD